MLNIKNDNEKLNYVGNFGTFSKKEETIKFSQNKGDYVELNFIGNKVRFYSHTNAWRGKANIYIDDIKIDTIDTYSQEEKMDVLSYESEELGYGEHKIKIEVLGEKREEGCIFNNISPRLYISKTKENDLHTIFNNCLFNNSMPYNFNNILGVFNNCVFENTPSIGYCGAEFNDCKLNNVKSNLVNIYSLKAKDTVFNNTEIILDTNNTNPLVNISWRKDEDIYNFYFNNCALPINYVFCPNNKTNWIKQIILLKIQKEI